MVRSGNRMEIAAPCGTNGAITACTRMPSGLAASAIGQASSSLRPSCAHSWTAYSRTTCGERNGTCNTVSRMPLPRSAQTRPSQVTAKSVTCGSDATSSSRPKNMVLSAVPASLARVLTAAIASLVLVRSSRNRANGLFYEIGKQVHGFATAFGHRSDAEAFQYGSAQIDTWLDGPQYRGSQIVLRLANTHVASPTWSATWFHTYDMWRFTAP